MSDIKKNKNALKKIKIKTLYNMDLSVCAPCRAHAHRRAVSSVYM